MSKKLFHTNPTLSIVIPTLNAECTIGKLLKKLVLLYPKLKKEIIIIDSTSTDETIKIINEYKKQDNKIFLHIIGKEKFNHGRTRNLGIKLARGKYILFLSQDAIPEDLNFIKYFIKDLEIERAVAVFGKEIAKIKKPFFQYLEHKLWYERLDDYTNNKLLIFDKRNPFISLTQENELFWYSLSNVFACYRRSFLLKHPFNKIVHGEDVLMGKYIMENNFIKIYDARCKVEHFHSFNLLSYYRRQKSDYYFRNFIVRVQSQVKESSKRKFILKSSLPMYKKVFYLFQMYFYYIIKIIAIVDLYAAFFIDKFKRAFSIF